MTVAQRSDFQVLIDSDAWIALYLEHDILHAQASELFDRLLARQAVVATTSLVMAETATVLSYRGSQSLARIFLRRIRGQSHSRPAHY